MAIDPNAYKDGFPLTPSEVMDRIATDLESSAVLEGEYEALKATAKAKKKKSDAIVEGVRQLSALHKMKRPVYLLVDGTLTAEPPKSLPLWEQLEKSQERAIADAKRPPAVALIYTRYGEGRADGVAFDRTISGGVVVHVQTEVPGEWRAKVGNEPVPDAPWRSAADAMLAALSFSKDIGAANLPDNGWAVGTVTPTEAPKPDDEEEDDDEAEKAIPPAFGKSTPETLAKAEAAVAAAIARTWPKTPADGTIFRSVHEKRALAVCQSASPGPWFGYVGGVRVGIVGADGAKVEEFETPDAAKGAVALVVSPDTKGPAKLTWASKLADGAEAKPETAEAPEAPKRRTRAK